MAKDEAAACDNVPPTAYDASMIARFSEPVPRSMPGKLMDEAPRRGEEKGRRGTLARGRSAIVHHRCERRRKRHSRVNPAILEAASKQHYA